jgi:hypothetical protein
VPEQATPWQKTGVGRRQRARRRDIFMLAV